LENAGAQKVFLIIKRNEELYIEASGTTEQNQEIKVMQAEFVRANTDLPESIVNYITRTKETVVLDNASESGQFLNDPYIGIQQPKSVLCIPVISQGELKGALYLENNLAEGAFTEDRVVILNILSSQLAISIENAQFYTQLDEFVNKHSQGLAAALDDLNKTRNHLIDPAKMAEFGQIVADVTQEINIPHLKNLHNLQNTISVLKSNLIHPIELENNNRLLSKREAEVAELLCQRLTMSEIALKLALSPRTVQTYIENIKEKLGVRTKRELILKLIGKEAVRIYHKKTI
jgi:DNA-binding CsgD family transcriptional regulator